MEAREAVIEEIEDSRDRRRKGCTGRDLSGREEGR